MWNNSSWLICSVATQEITYFIFFILHWKAVNYKNVMLCLSRNIWSFENELKWVQCVCVFPQSMWAEVRCVQVVSRPSRTDSFCVWTISPGMRRVWSAPCVWARSVGPATAVTACSTANMTTRSKTGPQFILNTSQLLRPAKTVFHSSVFYVLGSSK